MKARYSLFCAGGAMAAAFAYSPFSIAAVEGYATLNGGTTGGEGGTVVYASTGTEINAAMCNRPAEDSPLIIYVTGTINHGNTTKVSGTCDTTGEEIQFKRVSNISLIGAGQGAVLDQIGIHLREASNIVIRNLTIRNVKKSGSPTSNGGDAIGMEVDVFNVWIDHNTLEASGGESEGYDALVDMKATTQYVTVSYNKLFNSGRGGLIGSSDSDDTNTYITFHHNWYDTIDSRTPLLRHGTAHAYNNYYRNIVESGMNPRIGGQILVENNHFEDSKNVLGTFYTSEMGYWDVSGNIFEDIVWEAGDERVPAGPNPISTTSITVPYSYQLDDASCVRSLVMTTAGAGTGFAESDGSCGSQPGDGGGGDDGGDNGGGDDGGGDDGGDNGGGDDGGSDGGDLGPNLSIGAGSDGSSKGMGSYGNVRDGDPSSFWAPSGATGRVSIKWGSDTTVSTVVIREAAGYQGNIGSWSVVDHDDGTVLATGSGAGTIDIPTTTLRKIDFNILGSSGTPTVAEFETYAGN